MKIGKIHATVLTAVLAIAVITVPQHSASASETFSNASETKVTAKDLGLGDSSLIKQSEGLQAVQYVDEQGKIQVRNAIVTEYHPVDANAYLEASGQKPLQSGEKLLKVVDVEFVDNNSRVDPNSSVGVAAIGDLYTKNPSSEYPTYGTSIVASAEENGSSGGTLTLSQSVTVGNSYNANATVNVSFISATVGYTVTDTWASTASFSESIKKDNKKTIINAYSKYMTRHYEVWKTGLFSDSLVTHGTADRQVGFKFDIVQVDGYPSM